MSHTSALILFKQTLVFPEVFAFPDKKNREEWEEGWITVCAKSSPLVGKTCTAHPPQEGPADPDISAVSSAVNILLSP